MSEEERQRDAKTALERVDRDAETLGGSGIARAGERLGRHFSGADAPVEADGAADWAEVWGRRIGRALSLVGAVVLAYLLGVQLKLW
jgi:tetrahydromethanopterin S-methyltransferase subunit G